jgi:hypothetical protein
MAKVIREQLGSEVNVPDGELVQFTTAFGAARLGHYRLIKLQQKDAVALNDHRRTVERV